MAATTLAAATMREGMPEVGGVSCLVTLPSAPALKLRMRKRAPRTHLYTTRRAAPSICSSSCVPTSLAPGLSTRCLVRAEFVDDHNTPASFTLHKLVLLEKR
mmetsp:Transcript_13242/g.28603  ORF Transcript_13242/g.28603 Transcript_13242/m.28603 type:complete len:102 (-) Transcript_13242:197-502(-)